jgi:hypothetical protein
MWKIILGNINQLILANWKSVFLFTCGLLVGMFLLSCSSLMPIAGGATGAAAGAALGTPTTAALGAAVGVVGAQAAFPDDAPLETPVGLPAPGTAASTIHETKELVWDIGWMYLLIFVVVPLLTKKGRGWVRKFADIHNTVSQKEVDARIVGLEDSIKSLQNK